MALLFTAVLFGALALTVSIRGELDTTFDEAFTVGLVHVDDPDRDCKKRTQLSKKFAEVVRNGQSCVLDSDCVLIDGWCNGIPVARAAADYIEGWQKHYEAIVPTLSCSYSSMAICPAPGKNPAAVCEEQKCTYADIGLPPGLNRPQPIRL